MIGSKPSDPHRSGRASQADVAEAVGVAQRTVARWELGQNPHAKHLVRYIAVLDELKALA